MKTRLLLLLAVALLANSVSAQKMPVPGSKGQIVQLHDAAEWLALAVSSEAPDARAAKKTELLAGMAGFARAFISPPLKQGEDITPLGDRYLVAIGSPEHQAWLTRLLQRHLKNVVYEVHLEVRQFALSEKAYTKLVAPLATDPVARQPGDVGKQHSVLSSAHADALVKALDDAKDVDKISAAHSLVGPMGVGAFKVGAEHNYVKDFDVEILSHKAVATPVYATIYDGLKGKAFCGRLANRRLGVAIDFSYKELEKPIKTFETDLGLGKKLKIELPATASLRLRRNLILPDLRAADLYGRDAALCSFEFEGRRMVFVIRAGATR